jgi:hypothetical protein
MSKTTGWWSFIFAFFTDSKTNPTAMRVSGFLKIVTVSAI